MSAEGFLVERTETGIQQTPEGRVYCILHHERRAAKIGFSADPQKRLRQLQTASADMLTLFDSMKGDRALERAFHDHFAARRLSGEWFDNADHSVADLFGRMAWQARMSQ